MNATPVDRHEDGSLVYESGEYRVIRDEVPTPPNDRVWRVYRGRHLVARTKRIRSAKVAIILDQLALGDGTSADVPQA